MASVGPAIFSGLLSGLSGLPAGMQAATNEDLARQRLGMEQQQIDLQKQAMQGVEVPSSAVPGGWGAPGPTGGTMLKPQVLPFLQHFTTQQQAQQDRAGGAAALRAAGEKLGNPNLSILADLLDKGALKDAGGAFETEQKGMQAVADANRTAAIINAIMSGQPIDIPTMAPRGTPQTPPPLGVSTAMPPAQAADLANAQRGVAAASQGATAAINAYDKTPRAVPGLIGPPGAGSGGPLTPMPQTPSAFRPDLSLKLGPLTLGLKTPSDERDSYASAMFQGRLFHQLTPPEQQRVLDALPTSPGERLKQAAAQGQNAASIALEKAKREVLPPSQAAELGVAYGTTQEGAYGRKPLTPTQQTKVDAQSSVLAIINNVEQDLKKIQTPSGPLGRIYQAPQNMWGVYAQADPELAALNGRIGGTLSLIIRSLGEVGTLTDRDIARAQALMPKFVPIPDSQETIAAKMNGLRQLVQDVAGRAGTRPETTPAPRATPQAAPAPTGPKRRRYNPATGLLE